MISNKPVARSHIYYSEFAGTDAEFNLAVDLYRNECTVMAVESVLVPYASTANT